MSRMDGEGLAIAMMAVFDGLVREGLGIGVWRS